MMMMMERSDNNNRHCGNCGEAIDHKEKFYIIPVHTANPNDTKVRLDTICSTCYDYFTDNGKKEIIE